MYVLEKNNHVTVMTRESIEWLTQRNFYDSLDYLEFKSGVRVTPINQYLKPASLKYLRACLTASASKKPKMDKNQAQVIHEVLNMKGSF